MLKHKYVATIFFILITLSLTSCSNKVEAQDTAKDIIDKTNDSTDNLDSSTDIDSDVDIDLTKMSSTIVYSEVYNMMYYPEDYVDKTVRASGNFAVYTDETTNTNYYAVIIADATACCAQGLEFVLSDEYTYPDDYPEIGEEITVNGTFSFYTEGMFVYCTLDNATLE